MRLNLNIHIKLLISKQDETLEDPELHGKFSCKILNFSPISDVGGERLVNQLYVVVVYQNTDTLYKLIICTAQKERAKP